jgi:hypothetical protein
VTRIVNDRALREQATEYLRKKVEQSPEMAALKAENEEMRARLAALGKALPKPPRAKPRPPRRIAVKRGLPAEPARDAG